MSRPTIPGGAFGASISRLTRWGVIGLSAWRSSSPQHQVVALGSPVGYWVASTPRQPWSLVSSDDRTVRVELRSGDLYTSDSWTDVDTTERCELYYADLNSPLDNKTRTIPNGTACAIEFDVTKRHAGLNTAWQVLFQVFAETAGGSPPIELSFGTGGNAGKLGLGIRTDSTEDFPWAMAAPMVDNQTYRARCEWTLNADATGTVKFWWDGVLVLNFSGAVGKTGQTGQKLAFGCYRGESAQTAIFDYRVIGVQIGTHSTF